MYFTLLVTQNYPANYRKLKNLLLKIKPHNNYMGFCFVNKQAIEPKTYYFMINLLE